jgi:hypothetical protein
MKKFLKSNISVFDKILMHKSADQRIIANTYLHILSTAHTNLLENYNLSTKGKIWASIRSKLVLVVRAFQFIFNGKYYCTRQKNVKSDVLFVSHLTNKQQLSKDNDAYFGDLPNQLLLNGISSCIVLMNHAKVNKRQMFDGWNGSEIPRFVLFSCLGFLSEIRLYLAQRKSEQQLKYILKDLKIDKTLVEEILYNHFSSGTFEALRVAKQIANIANRTNARFIVTTYEGHAWECLVYYYARQFNPDIKCFGYQHAAVFEHQHAIKRPLGKKYNPDVILTSGLLSQAIFNRIKSIKSNVVCLGSPQHNPSEILLKKTQCCLVVPQAEVAECMTLFEFSLTYAKQHQENKFIWRLHPLMSFDNLKKHSAIFNNLPDNIYLSECGLDEDIQKCDSVLYRGSTAVVKAINLGLKPIYFQQSTDELSIDSIYQLQQGKEVVHNQKELNLALNKSIDKETKQALQDFAQDFFTLLDVQALKDAML